MSTTRNRALPRLALVALLLTCSPALLFSASPEPVWTGVDRVVAVGDLHADFDQFVKCLRAASVVDDKNNWIAGKTHLVQTGDILDRGPDSRSCLDLLMKLGPQAAKAGGMVHVLIGNHEIGPLRSGESRESSPEELKGFGGPDGYRAAFAPDGVYGSWLRKCDIAIKINDTLFCHAGVTPDFATQSLAQLNDAIRAQLASGKRSGPATEPEGPLRTTFYAYAPEPDVAKALDIVFKAYSAKHMVIGHAIDQTGVLTRDHGRLIRIDVGMSRVTGGPAACLLIEKGLFYEIRFPDSKTKLNMD